MKLFWVWTMGVLVLLLAVDRGEAFAGGSLRILDRQGGELGNSFVPFDSKIGDYSLEYNKKWRFNDLSVTANFSDSEADLSTKASFVAISLNRTGGPQTIGELRDRLAQKHPGLEWADAKLSGLSGLKGEDKGITFVYLLRAPGDMLSLSFRSTGGERTDKVIAHMLESLRVE